MSVSDQAPRSQDFLLAMAVECFILGDDSSAETYARAAWLCGTLEHDPATCGMCEFNEQIDAALEAAKTVGGMPEALADRITDAHAVFVEKYGGGNREDWDHTAMSPADLNSAHELATWMANYDKESTP